jgi:ribosomal protein S18 acetylase RimI-like enzyme
VTVQPFTIRPLQTADAEQWRALRLEMLRTYPSAFSASFDDAKDQDLAAFAARIPPPGGPSALFGALAGGTLVGTAGLHVHAGAKQSHKAELWTVYVRPLHQRRGIATALLQAAIDHARTRVAVLQLVVGTDNAAARALYRRLGFASYGVERRALRIGGRDYDNDLLALSLD